MQKVSSVLIFGLACALGAWSRYFFLEFFVYYAEFAELWGVFCVNIIGCFGFGLLWNFTKYRRIFLTGFMASFTTFSSYIFEAYLFIQSKDWWLLLCNTFMQIILGLIAIQLGLFFHKKLFNDVIYSSK